MHIKIFNNINLHFWGSRSRQSDDRHTVVNGLNHRSDTTIFRSKIMSPFRNTMRFIHTDERDFCILKKLNIFIFREGLGRNIKEFGFAIHDVLFHFFNLGAGERRVQKMRHFVVIGVTTNRIHLVFHQSNEGRYNQGRAFHHQCR